MKEKVILILVAIFTLVAGICVVGYLTYDNVNNRVEYSSENDEVKVTFDDDRERYDCYVPGLNLHTYIYKNEASIYYVESGRNSIEYVLQTYKKKYLRNIGVERLNIYVSLEIEEFKKI